MARPVAEAQIDIDAPIELVWRVMLDFARYPEWNPFIVRVENMPAVPAVGAAFKLHVRWKNGKGDVSNESITRLEPPSSGAPRRALLEYRYGGLLSATGMVRGERTQALTEEREGRVRYHTREEFRGLLTAFLPLADVRDGFERHARALKSRAEALKG